MPRKPHFVLAARRWGWPLSPSYGRVRGLMTSVMGWKPKARPKCTASRSLPQDPTSWQNFSYCFASTAAAIRLTASITVSGRSSWTSWPLPCATIKLPCGERAASCCWSRIKVGSHSLK
jgi:hypothetical protein